MGNCKMCVQDRRECLSCMDNPVFSNVPTESKFVPYIPLCPIGDGSCAFDPAYIRLQNPEWYRKLFGDMEPDEAMRECLRQTGQMPEEKVYFVSCRLRITEEGGVYTIYDAKYGRIKNANATKEEADACIRDVQERRSEYRKQRKNYR
ncbi:MAG: hypothetical protein IJ716_14975 [Lachnospiraceae bacterium]|nr:hypothetical protein [Lachnospiraceae bacterium]